MTDKIILNIHHSDDYTDYLFLTAGLTDKRIVPIIDPTPAEIKAQSDINTLVLGCYNSRREPRPEDSVASYDATTHNIQLLSKRYLLEDGAVNATQAELARTTIQEKLDCFLYSEDNLHEYYRRNFPLLWRKRPTIYDNPHLFFAKTGMFNSSDWSYFPLGVLLKAIEENEDLFRAGKKGCNCEEPPLIIDFDTNHEGRYDNSYLLYTWCPRCHSRREVGTDYIGGYESCLISTYRDYDRRQGLSALTLFDVIEQLSISNYV
ncbi:MAG: hypothetical protein J5737_02670 [Bacteroidales bacterium]|nr:hypothetical protein [Bacteroidales bacterium]